MGKSTVSGMFAELGVPTFDADEAVRHFYAGEGAAVVEAAFPGVVVSGQVDRERLGSQVLGDAEAYEDADAAKKFFDAGRPTTGPGSLTVVAALERPAAS